MLIYELAAGACPFYSEDRMQMYRMIVAANLKCPTHFSPVSVNAIACTLRRVGEGADGWETMQLHTY